MVLNQLDNHGDNDGDDGDDHGDNDDGDGDDDDSNE